LIIGRIRPSWLWIALLTGDWRNLLLSSGPIGDANSLVHVVQKLGPVTYADQAERDYAILVKAIRA